MSGGGGGAPPTAITPGRRAAIEPFRTCGSIFERAQRSSEGVAAVARGATAWPRLWLPFLCAYGGLSATELGVEVRATLWMW